MPVYSKQYWFCTNCGWRQYQEMPSAMGKEWKVCSKECLRSIALKYSLSVMGEPDFDLQKEGNNE